MVNAVPSQQVLRHHIEHIARSVYLIPEFQRTFVWDDERVQGLWESLYRGFPVGQLMLWQPDSSSEFPMRSLGKNQEDIRAASSPIAVIDGQQRLTAIWLVLTGEVPLLFDLAKESFSYKKGENTIRLDILWGEENRNIQTALTQGFRYHCSLAQQESYLPQILSLDAILHQYQLPSQTIYHASYPVVVDIFRRLNKNGQPLSEGQLTMAGIASVWPGVFRRTYNALKKLNDTVGYDQTSSPDFVFLVWAALHSGQPRLNRLYSEQRQFDASSYELSWGDVEKGLEGLIRLMQDIGIANFRFIRAEYPFVVAANFFGSHGGEIDDRSYARLRSWVLLALVAGRYHIRAKSRLNADVRATAAGRPIDDLFRTPEALDPDLSLTTHLNVEQLCAADFRSAYASLLYLLMSRQRATDWFQRDRPVGDSREIWEYHHIFPRATFADKFDAISNAMEEADEEELPSLREKFSQLQARLNSIGNLTFITKSTNASINMRFPSDYLKEVADREGGAEQLRRHFIPMDPELWTLRNFDRFCQERCKILVSEALSLANSSSPDGSK